jgi:hypothetical protein
MDASDEIIEVNLDARGKVVEVSDKKLLIDADTVVFAVALTTEQEIELLPEEFYSEEEWKEYTSNPTYDSDKEVVYTIDLELAYDKVLNRIKDMMLATGTSSYELHFTTGRESFRYVLAYNYKGNRTGYRVPLGNAELKKMLCEAPDVEAYCHTKVEADDVVVAKYDPEKHILCAIDKDVLYSVVGKHWNYYSSAKHNIEPKWVGVDEVTAMKHPYHQTLTGDKQDNIITWLYRVGKVTADKILAKCTTKEECWDAVVAEYEKQGKTEEDAVYVMRLVNMFQYDDTTKAITLWMQDKYPLEEIRWLKYKK